MHVRAIRTRLFVEGERIAPFVREHIDTMRERSVVVVTSKIVALAERRSADPSRLEQLIAEESEWAAKSELVWLTRKDGMLMANAGIDASNGDGRIILLPRDSFAAAERIRSALKRSYGVRDLGIIISDSRCVAGRAGVIGVALGYAGFAGIRDYTGSPDLYGRPLTYSKTDIADSLASAAIIEMGEGDEQCPLAVIDSARVEFTGRKADPSELCMPAYADMFKPLFRRM